MKFHHRFIFLVVVIGVMLVLSKLFIKFPLRHWSINDNQIEVTVNLPSNFPSFMTVRKNEIKNNEKYFIFRLKAGEELETLCLHIQL